MTWTLVATGAVSTPTSGNIVPGEPAGAASGDLLVATITYRNGASSALLSAPAGWTVVQHLTDGTVPGVGVSTVDKANAMLAYIVRGASAPSYTFTRTGGDIGSARVIAYRASAGTPTLVTSSGTRGGSNVTSHSASGITTTGANQLLVVALGLGRSASFSNINATSPSTSSGSALGNSAVTTALSSTAWVQRHYAGATTGLDYSNSAADAIKATAGATGNITFTTTANAASHALVAAFSEGAVGGTITSLTPQNPGTIYEASLGAGAPVQFTVTSTNITSLSWVVSNGAPGFEWQSAPNVVATSGSVQFTANFTADGQFLKVWDTNNSSMEALSGAVNVEVVAATNANPSGGVFSTGVTFAPGTPTAVRQAPQVAAAFTPGVTFSPATALSVRQAPQTGAAFAASASFTPATAGVSTNNDRMLREDGGAVLREDGGEIDREANGAVGTDANPSGAAFATNASFAPATAGAVQQAPQIGATFATSVSFSPATPTAVVRQHANPAGASFTPSITFTPGVPTAVQVAAPSGFNLTTAASFLPGTPVAVQRGTPAGAAFTTNTVFAPGTASVGQTANPASAAFSTSASFAPATASAVQNANPAAVAFAAGISFAPATPTAARAASPAGTALTTSASFAPATPTAVARQHASPTGGAFSASASFAPATPTATSPGFNSLTPFELGTRFEPSAGAGVSIQFTAVTTLISSLSWVVSNGAPGYEWQSAANVVPTTGTAQFTAQFTQDGQFLKVWDTNDPSQEALTTAIDIETGLTANPTGAAFATTVVFSPGTAVAQQRALPAGAAFNATSAFTPAAPSIIGGDTSSSSVLREDGGSVLREDGGRIYREEQVADTNSVIREDGGRVLREDGGFISREDAVVGIDANPAGAAFATTVTFTPGVITAVQRAFPLGFALAASVLFTAGLPNVSAAGGYILREDGGRVLREDGGFVVREDQPVVAGYRITREDGGFVLREDGGTILREDQPGLPISASPPGAAFGTTVTFTPGTASGSLPDNYGHITGVFSPLQAQVTGFGTEGPDEEDEMAFEVATGTAAAALTGGEKLAVLQGGVARVMTTDQLQSRPIQAISAAAVISAGVGHARLTIAGTNYSVTLPAPRAEDGGRTLVVEMVARTSGSVTMSLGNVDGGSAGNTATFSAVGQKLLLVAGATKWTVLKEIGVSLT